MYFELVTGGAGSGKSAYLEDKIAECINAGKRAMVIVPERFSHVQEQTLCDKFGGLGINGVEVSTFSKLARRLEDRGEYLRPSGRQMLILKAVLQNSQAGDGVFESASDRSGFVDRVSDIISEFKRCLVTPDMLLEYSGGGISQKKLNALGEIYKTYNSILDGKFADPDEDMQLLAERIENDGGFSDTQIFIDGFGDFLPSHYLVISALLKWADKMYAAVTITDSGMRNNEGVFAPAFECMSRLLDIAKERGAEVQKTHIPGEGAHIKAPDIKYFIQNYDEYQPGSICPACKNISVTAVGDRYAEIRRLAGRIMHLVRDKGMRFRDIGVIAGDIDAYEHIIDAVFTDAGISFYTDRKMTVSEHPVIRLVLSVFRIINENWSFSAVFEYLRCGYIFRTVDEAVVPVEPREIDLLEDYVSAHGIRGRKYWLSEEKWEAKKTGIFEDITSSRASCEDITGIDNLRRELMRPFAAFVEKIKGRRKVRDLCTALFEFLEDIHLYEGLQSERTRLEKLLRLEDAARLAQIWESLIEMLDQCVTTSGDEFVSREHFSKMIETGLSKCDIDAVPPGADSVAVGSCEETRPVRVRALFVIGAVRGELPPEQGSSGILNDADREEAKSFGITLAPGDEGRSALCEFKLYSALTAACEKLDVSYPESGDDGENNIPAVLIDELLRTFDDLEIRTPSAEEYWENLLISKKNTYYEMLTRLANGAGRKECEFWQKLAPSAENSSEKEPQYSRKASPDADFSIFNECGGYEDILSRAQRFKQNDEGISAETANALYSGRPFSITALQTYNRCPFSYYIQYGLGVYKNDEYKLRGYDLGQLVHWAICEFCKQVQKDAKTTEQIREKWKTLDTGRADEIINTLEDYITDTAKKANPDYGSERIELMCSRAVKTISESVSVIKKSITEGEFASCEFEKEFLFTLESGGKEVDIKGVIDRIDAAKVAGDTKALLRIIDYKTGAQSFSIAGIVNKTDMQLMIYALAAEHICRKEGICGIHDARVAAVLYNKIRERADKIKDGKTSAKTDFTDGVIITENDSQNVDSEEIAAHDRNLLKAGVQSDFLPLSTKIDGKLKKSSCVIDSAKFKVLKNYAAKSACEIKSEIYGGRIDMLPIKIGNSTACEYCDYINICLHSKDDKIRKLITSESAAWDILQNGEDNDNE